MDNALDKKFNLASLLSFAMPNVIMMITLSLYIIVDGMFIARILGTTALSAANMMYPAICLEMAIAIMLATGGSAIIARKLGEGKHEEARKNLSFLILLELFCGVLIAIFGTFFIEEIVSLLGASEKQMVLCMTYGKILFGFAPAFFLQTAFQTFLVTAGKPTLGLVVTLLAGIVNIILDYTFMSPFQMGIAGAAIATGLGYCLPAITGLIYFLFTKHNVLHFTKPSFDQNVLIQSCFNGSSEMVTNLANAVTTFLFNYSFLQFYGENGVASITIILYFQYIFTALYFGYANGIAPIISFKYGKGDQQQLHSIFKNSLCFLVISSIIANLLIHVTLRYSLTFFTPLNSDVYQITRYGFSIYSIAFFIMGLGIFSSAMFTAFGDGLTSGIISFTRTFIFIIGAILILPQVIGSIGLWVAVPLAELLGFIISIFFLIRKRNYGYC